MDIIKSASGKTKVLLGSEPCKYYFRGIEGGIVNASLGATPKAWEYQDALIAHSGEVVMLVTANEAVRNMTFPPHYDNEPFFELWFIPLSSKLIIEGKKGVQEEPGKMRRNCVSTFLMRGQSKELFQSLILDIERDVFLENLERDLSEEETKQAIIEASMNSIYSFQSTGFETDYGTKYLLSWKRRIAETETEKEFCECAAKISGEFSGSLQCQQYEKAVIKASESVELMFNQLRNGNIASLEADTAF
ncbi:MAG: hypothetical protein WBF90_33915 [Rivularia sp. (in: cyanobacteria)]